ncbi:zinc finger protein 804A isoform X2 [Brienomyrus brachyistius]|nr:zinc finger protein 804A isoform X2 [Brienomyrus brachyistius]
MAKALDDLKANFYCELCDKQYYKHQEFDNHINSYDHAHKQRLKDLKQREFARNVASKSRKDERKQERALRRLHQLAEQRREVQCAPGCGPMFKSTTVAVESSFRDDCCRGSVGGVLPATLEPGAQSDASKQAQWPSPNKGRKQAYGQKIAFSFSFPKKASIRLESSAAVFCEAADEGSTRRSCRQKLRRAPVELLSTGLLETEKTVSDEDVAREAGAKRGEDQSSTEQRQGSSDPARKNDSPLPGLDLCVLLGNPLKTGSPCHVSQQSMAPLLNGGDAFPGDPVESLKSDTADNKLEHAEGAEQVLEMDRSVPLDGLPSLVKDTAASPEVDSHSHEKEVVSFGEKTPTPLPKPSQPFCSVLSRDGSTVLPWPSEMLTFTRTEPSLSYSCNPLHFDFKASSGRSQVSKIQEVAGPQINKESGADVTSAGPERPLHLDKHNKEASASLGDSSGQESSDGSFTQDLTDPAGRKEDHVCGRHARAVDGQKRPHKYKCNRRHSRERRHGKRRVDKPRGRDRCGRRSHKRRRRRKRNTQRERGRSRSIVERPENVLKGSGSWDECESQLGSSVSEQAEQLEDAEKDDGARKDAMETKSQEAEDHSNCGASVHTQSNDLHIKPEVELGNKDEDLRVLLEECGSLVQPCSCACGALNMGRSHLGSAREGWVRLGRCAPKFHQGCLLKRRRSESESEEDRHSGKRQPGSHSTSSVGGASENEDEEGQEMAHSVVSRCSKRQRRCSPNAVSNVEMSGPDRCISSMCLEDPLIYIDPESAGLENSIPEIVTDVSKSPLTPEDILIRHVNDERPLDNSGNQDSAERDSGDLVLECVNWLASPATNLNAQCSRDTILMVDPAVEMNAESEIKDTGAESAVPIPAAEGSDRPAAEVHLFQQTGEEPPRKEPQSHVKVGKPFQHSLQCPHERGPQGPWCQEGKLTREGLTSLQASPQGFQHLSDTEKHPILHLPVHRHTFPGKLKPVLSRPPVPVSQPVLHPVHLAPPMSSASITIRHTILQHHAAFLPPQTPLFSQVFPLARLPLGPEICPTPGPSAFMPQPQLSVMAPASIHPMAMTFHALPRPAMFPPVLPPHPAVIPLQPLF